MAGIKEQPRARGNIRYVLIDERTGDIVGEGQRDNIITDAGITDIAEAMARAYGSGTPAVTNVMNVVALGRTSLSPGAPAASNTLNNIGIGETAGLATVDSGYPKLNATTGDDASNSTSGGADILTWRATWAAGTYDYADIDDVAITESGAAIPASGESILNHSDGLAIDKSGGNKTLRLWVNISITRP